MKVAVVHAAIARDERDPSTLDVLDQERYVCEALREAGHAVKLLSLDRDAGQFLKKLKAYRPHCIFNLVESVAGDAGLHPWAAALSELIGMPHTGSSARAMDRTTDKALAKTMMVAAGIPTPSWAVCVTKNDSWRKVPGPWIVKPASEDASVGIEEDSVVRRRSAVGGKLRALREKFPTQPILVEHFVDGREFNISLLAAEKGPMVLPPAEMMFVDYPPSKERVMGFRAKWDRAAFEYSHTVRRFEFPPNDAALIQRIKNIAVRCWKLFDLRGYARVDMRVEARARVFVIEVNTNPCLSPDAGVAAAVSRAGISPARMVQHILEDLVCVPPQAH